MSSLAEKYRGLVRRRILFLFFPANSIAHVNGCFGMCWYS